MNEHIQKLHHKVGASPLILAVLGVGVLVLWLSCMLIQVETSEFLVDGSATQIANVPFSVFLQWAHFFDGSYPTNVRLAWGYGWSVEVVTLIFAVALSKAMMSLNNVNKHLGKGFFYVGGLLLILNSVADFNSAPGTNWLIHGLVAAVVGGIVVVGMPLGLGLIETAIEDYKD
jgi:hypothetical protein